MNNAELIKVISGALEISPTTLRQHLIDVGLRKLLSEAKRHRFQEQFGKSKNKFPDEIISRENLQQAFTDVCLSE